jgi:protease-4
VKGFQLLSSVLREPWAVHESISQAFMALLPAIQQGHEVDFQQFSFYRNSNLSDSDKNNFNEKSELTQYVNADYSTEESGPMEPTVPVSKTENKEYIAMISLVGVVMKYDTMCAYGTKSVAQAIVEANENPDVKGIVLNIDSPGGSVAGTEELANVIAGSDKPVVAYIDGMAASAAYWIAAQCDYIFVNGKTSTLGSIGTMVTIIDGSAAMDKMGAKVYELYARTSPEKNSATRELAKGKDKMILDRLDQYDAVFMEAVLNGRGKKLNADATLKGQDYLSEEAVQFGLADGIGTLKDAVNLVASMATSTNKPITGNNPMGLFGKSLPAAIAALAGKPISEITDTALNAANAALEAENIMGLELVNTEDVKSLQISHNALNTANADLATQLADVNSKLATVQSDLASAITRAEAAEAKAKSFGAQPGTIPANPQSIKTSEADAIDSNTFACEADRLAAESDKINAFVEI